MLGPSPDLPGGVIALTDGTDFRVDWISVDQLSGNGALDTTRIGAAGALLRPPAINETPRPARAMARFE